MQCLSVVRCKTCGGQRVACLARTARLGLFLCRLESRLPHRIHPDFGIDCCRPWPYISGLFLCACMCAQICLSLSTSAANVRLRHLDTGIGNTERVLRCLLFFAYCRDTQNARVRVCVCVCVCVPSTPVAGPFYLEIVTNNFVDLMLKDRMRVGSG